MLSSFHSCNLLIVLILQSPLAISTSTKLFPVQSCSKSHTLLVPFVSFKAVIIVLYLELWIQFTNTCWAAPMPWALWYVQEYSSEQDKQAPCCSRGIFVFCLIIFMPQLSCWAVNLLRAQRMLDSFSYLHTRPCTWLPHLVRCTVCNCYRSEGKSNITRRGMF